MFFREKPILIAGPCSAETREQVLETAAAAKEAGVHLFRSGVWKPRTKPGSFEGNGEKALPWLQEVKEKYQLPVTIEVAEPVHIELALKYGIDVLWIGARTTVNPFQVQLLADCLKGVSIPVMVKNPVNPDVDLWEGAIERFEQAGITEIAAVHRGFSTYQASSVYRNQPNWPIPIELKRRRPNLPVICDPSHITGKSELVAAFAQKALDMGFDGLMIETHPNPPEAWSDARQQISPKALIELLGQLIVRRQSPVDQSNASQLEQLRQLIDSLDAEIIDLLARRMELSVRIGRVKQNGNLTAYQPDRWREIIETRTAQGINLNMPESFVAALYEMIHDESIHKQIEIMQQTGKALNP